MGRELAECVVKDWLEANNPLELSKVSLTFSGSTNNLYIHSLDWSTQLPQADHLTRKSATLSKVEDLHNQLEDIDELKSGDLKVSAELDEQGWGVKFEYRL